MQPDDPAVGRAFGWINAIQWIAISVVAFSFAKLHLDAYVHARPLPPIVGLHMFPLARLFRYPLHYATGALLVTWAVVSVIAYPTENMQGAAALGTGVILWVSAAVELSTRSWGASAEPTTCPLADLRVESAAPMAVDPI